MRNVLGVFLAVLTGIVIGYFLGSWTTTDTPSQAPLKPRPGDGASAGSTLETGELATLRDELKRYRLDNEELRSRLAQGAAPDGEEAGHGGAQGARSISLTPFPVATDGTENPIRVAGESGIPGKGTLRVLVTGRDGSPLSGIEVNLNCYSASGGSTKHEGMTQSDGWASRTSRFVWSSSFVPPVSVQQGSPC